MKRATRSLEIFCTAAVAAGFVAVFFIGGSGLNSSVKVLLAAVVLIICIGFTFVALSQKRDRLALPTGDNESDLFEASVDEEFATLEEAAVFFSASLKSDEMFRLLKTRLEGLLPGCRFEFFASDESGGILQEVSRDGKRTGRELYSKSRDLAFKAFASRKKIRLPELKRISDAETSKYSSVAIPLLRGDEVFCILVASSPEKAGLPDENLLDAIAARVTPLIAGSLSFESTVSNALTDGLTRLPNERAMYLILENQVAEAQRFGKSRPLTLLAVDIDSFDEINARFGHAEGDAVLIFAAGLLRDQLRKMDFLARTSDDEFFVILPTAEGSSSGQVISRIAEAFEANPYKHTDGLRSIIKLNLGHATFGEHGETATSLIHEAVKNKQLNKPASGGSVLKFPTNKPN